MYNQIGLALYAAREYDRAQASFELIRDRDPYRVTNIDTYSNILYVKENHAELSHLAHALVKVSSGDGDKYRFVPSVIALVIHTRFTRWTSMRQRRAVWWATTTH